METCVQLPHQGHHHQHAKQPHRQGLSAEELQQIAALCQKWNCLAITDEIYDHILYDGAEHIRLLTLEGMRERTITINSLSKTFSVTGWRVGYVVASPELSNAIRKVHDFLTVGAAHPLQEAGAFALHLDDRTTTSFAANTRSGATPCWRS